MEEVAHLDIEKVPVVGGSTYHIAGVLNAGQGMLRREPIDGSETNYPALHRLRSGQLVMRKLTAWEGPITVVPEEFDGYVVSTEFPTFSLDVEAILPAFMQLICQQPQFWEKMRSASTGTVQRRKRVNPSQLLAIEVALPPVDEQRRIVDLIGSLDKTRSAFAKGSIDARQLASALIEDGLRSCSEVADLDQLILGIEAGKSPPAEDRLPEPGEVAVLKVSAVRPGFFDPTEAKVIPDANGFPPHARLESGDLLITRANTRSLVGSVCRVDEAPTGYFLCDKTLRLIPKDIAVSPDYLLLALQSRGVRRQIEDAATGTSGSMKNISQTSIRALRVPLMPRSMQDRWTSAALEAISVSRAASMCGRRATHVRTALLTDLLSGAHAIPDSYDAFLERAS